MSELRNLQAEAMSLTLDALRAAVANAGPGPGRKALFPDKAAGLVYLTPFAKARLIALSKNANVSQSDFLEVLIRRFGIQAGSEIIDAKGGNDDGASSPGESGGDVDPV